MYMPEEFLCAYAFGLLMLARGSNALVTGSTLAFYLFFIYMADNVGQQKPFRLEVGIHIPEVLSENQHATCGEEVVDVRDAGCHKKW